MKRSLFLALAALLVIAPGANSQGKGFFDFYTFKLGVGSGFPIAPDGFKDDWNPAFGLGFAVGAQKEMVEVAADFNFDFFVEDAGVELLPDDINVLTIFLTVKIKPIETRARPYIMGGGGYYRFWSVSPDIYENMLGYTGGAGLEVELNKKQQLFLEGRYLVGRLRLRELGNEIANIETISARLGISWIF